MSSLNLSKKEDKEFIILHLLLNLFLIVLFSCKRTGLSWLINIQGKVGVVRKLPLFTQPHQVVF